MTSKLSKFKNGSLAVWNYRGKQLVVRVIAQVWTAIPGNVNRATYLKDCPVHYRVTVIENSSSGWVVAKQDELRPFTDSDLAKELAQ